MSTKFYSPSEKGFFDTDVHGKDMPEDVIEISDETHAALLEAQSRGRIIDAGPDGTPIARDLNDQELSSGRRRARDQLLSETDWLVARHRDEKDAESDTTLTGEQFEALQAYRARLRALTQQPGWPRVSFPARPEGI